MIKSMNRILVIAICITLLTGSLLAQENRRQQGPPQPPTDEQIEKMIEMMTEKLSLTEIQQQQMTGLYIEHFDEMRSSLQNRNEKPDKETMDAKRKEFDVKIEKILTSEQKKLFADFRKHHRPPKQDQERRRR